MGGGGVWVGSKSRCECGERCKDLPNHDADFNVDRQSGSCKSIPANQQHPRHERTRKSKGSFGRSGRKSGRKMVEGGLGMREQKVMKRICRLGPASVARIVLIILVETKEKNLFP